MFGQFFLSSCLFLSFLHQAIALTLRPLASEHFVDNPRVTKRNWNGTDDFDPSRLDLQDIESFYWGGDGGGSLLYANLTVYFKEEFEFVIGMEKFDGMLKSVDCSNNMMLEFKDNATFTYAKQAWNWVSDDVNNTFVLVANYEGCGDDQERQPYLVNDITFDPAKFKVHLKAQQKEWEDVAKTYTFKMGYRPPLNTTILAKRDDPDFTMSLASSFNRNLFSTTVSGVDLSVDCVDCGTSGKMLVDFDLDVGFSGAKAQMKVSPQDVVATIQLSLSASGTLAKEYNWQKTIISIPIEGVKVGKFAKIGAFLDVDVGFTMDEWKGEVEATFGAKMSLSNSAIVEINALEPSKGKFSGWAPALTAIPFTLSAKIDGGIELYAQPAIALSAVAFGKGLEMSLDLKMPTIQADFTAMAVTSGVCGTEKTVGVDVDASAGVDLSVQVATAGNEANPLWEQTLFEQSWPLFSKCFPFGPNNAVSGATPQPKPPKKQKTKQPQPKTKKPIKPKPTQQAPVKTLKPVKPTKKATKPPATKNTKTSDDDSKPTTKQPATKGKSTSDDDNTPTSKPPATKNTKSSDDDTTPTAKPGSSNSKPTASPTKVSSKDDESTSKSKSISPSSTNDDSKPSGTISGKSDSKTAETFTIVPGSSKTGSADGTTSISKSSDASSPLPSSFLTVSTSKTEDNDNDAGKTSKTAEESKTGSVEPSTAISTGTNQAQTGTASQIEPTSPVSIQPSNTGSDTNPGVTQTEIRTTPPVTEQSPVPSSPADTKPGETVTEIKTRTESSPSESTPIETKPGETETETETESKNEPEPTPTGSKPISSSAASTKSGKLSTKSKKTSTSKASAGTSSKTGTTKAPTTTKSGTNTGKVTSGKSSSSSSSQAVACRIPKRGAVVDQYCDDKGHTHTTETTSIVPVYTTPPVKCSKRWSQACYHYRSVMSVHTNKVPPQTDMARFTCGETTTSSVDGKATDLWSSSYSKTVTISGISTVVATVPESNQHHFGWLDGWTQRRQGKCDRDEWPPRAFWNKKDQPGQMVRYLPSNQNRGSGSMWKNFCWKHGGDQKGKDGVMTKQSASHVTMSSLNVERVVTESGYTTTITSVRVQVTRPVFEIKDWDNLPNDPEDGLEQNPCWPSMIVPNDPGFALLTDDNYYTSNAKGKLASSTKNKYASAPDPAITAHLTPLWSATKSVKPATTSTAEPADDDTEDVEEDNEGNSITPRGLVIVRSIQNGTEVEEWVDWRELEEQGIWREAVISGPAEVEALPTPVVAVQNAKSTLSTVVRTGVTAGLPATTGV